MSIFYLDPVNGSDSNNGSTWGLAWKTITSGATAARIAPGDTIRIAKSGSPTSLGNATWTDASDTVTLASAATKTIDNCETAWEIAAGGDVSSITATATSSYGKEGTNSLKFVLDSAVQTNKLESYLTLGSTLDLSSYQEVCLWIYVSSSLASSGRLNICLCSDTVGATVVDTIAIPALSVSNNWFPINVGRTGGGNLGSNINSIAIYTGASAPSNGLNFYIDNIFATTTNGLNLQSLISKSSSDTQDIDGEAWWAINSIDETDIKLQRVMTAALGTAKYYTSSTSPDTVTTYYRNTTKTTVVSNSTTVVQAVQDSGTDGSNITFSGGWNTSTSTQDGMTWFDGTIGYGYGLSFESRDYITVSGIGFVRYNIGSYISTTGYGNGFNLSISNAVGGVPSLGTSVGSIVLTNSTINVNSSYSSISINSKTSTVNTYTYGSDGGTYYGRGNTYYIKVVGQYSNYIAFYSCYGDAIIDSYKSGLVLNNYGNNNYIHDSTINNSTTYALRSGAGNFNKIYNLTANNSGTATLQMAGAGQHIEVKNLTTNDSTIAIVDDSAESYHYGRICIDNINSDTNDNRIYSQHGYSMSQTTTRHTASGVAWQTFVTNVDATSAIPLRLSIAKIACVANKLVTVSAYVKLSHATDIGAKLCVLAAQLPGITVTQTDTKAADTDWEQLSVSFTPTAAGVVEVELLSYWLANEADESTYVDDITVTQAD